MTSADDIQYNKLPYDRKKLVQFCTAEHTNDMPLLPLFPMSKSGRLSGHTQTRMPTQLP